jgi:3-oxoacyl-[acyl-carrier protein] reductase
MDLGIGGKVALVTGASKGIGFGIAKALADEGARVAVCSRSRERIDAAAAGIGGAGFVHDSAALDAAAALAEQVQAALGPVEILVTNTGGPPGNPDALGFSRAQWQDAYRDLMLAPMTLIEAVLPGMRARGWGRVVNLSSTSVREPIPALMLSNAHRTGMLAAFKTLARQVAGDGVTFNTVLPGRIATDRAYQLAGGPEGAERWAAEHVPAGRMGTVAEVAAAAAFLCSAQATYITGTTLLVDGGLTHSIA